MLIVVAILLGVLCRFHFQQKHFNLFILGLILLMILIIVLFWLMARGEDLEDAQSMRDKR